MMDGAPKACHPEAQAHRTGPQHIPRGPKDLAADTYQPGRGSGTDAWASVSSRLADGGAFRMAPAHSPAALSPGPSPASGRGENSTALRKVSRACR